MAVPRLDLTTEEIDGDFIILDRQRNKVHQLNSTASLVWKRLAACDSMELIVDKLVSEYNASRNTVLADVIDIVRQFDDLGLLKTDLKSTQEDVENGGQ